MIKWLTANVGTITSINAFFQIVTNSFLILSVIFIGYQAWMYRIDYKEKNRRSNVEKAAELSKFYAENIINTASCLIRAYNNIGLTELIEKLNINDLCEFDMTELYTLVTPEELDDYLNKLRSIDPMLVISTKYLHNKIDFPTYQLLATHCEACKNDSEHIFNQQMCNEFNLILVELLNYLEYFAMNFNDDIADELTVYQSLHQTYLQIIKMAYISISLLNKSECDKYYVHIIELFNRWKKIYLDNLHKEIIAQSELEIQMDRLKIEQKQKTKIKRR